MLCILRLNKKREKIKRFDQIRYYAVVIKQCIKIQAKWTALLESLVATDFRRKVKEDEFGQRSDSYNKPLSLFFQVKEIEIEVAVNMDKGTSVHSVFWFWSQGAPLCGYFLMSPGKRWASTTIFVFFFVISFVYWIDKVSPSQAIYYPPKVVCFSLLINIVNNNLFFF